MADTTQTTGLKDPPATPAVTYKNPRRTSPENSITLRHHRMAREASRRNASMAAAAPLISITKSPRRNSSKESQDTGTSDPTRWFDQSNEHRNAVFDSTMDVDPPFFQRASESSNEEGGNYLGPNRSSSQIRPSLEHKASSGDGFRSIIDDLTVENKRLRDELKKFKQMGPDSLRREKLFEVKVHGLPSRRKRELEAALRDFTTSLDGSSPGGGSQRKNKAKLQGLHSSKHASSTSGSNDRAGAAPPDSAYASNSTNQSSSDPFLPGKLSRQPSDQPVAQSLPDVPEGLWPRQFALTEADKQKLVVRRLEQIFTGKDLGPSQQQPHLPLVPPAISEEVEMTTMDDQNPSKRSTRQATILPHSQRKASHSRDYGSASNSNEDQTDSREQGNTSGSGSGSGSGGSNEVSPPSESQSEQRPTRPRDLDPDRPQVPAENMQYIRHLSDTGPEQHNPAMNGLLDADGWVYLNLLSNLAQLHMLNVTPSFIRNAVAKRSQKFQLSSDGHKIRWKGGVEGSKFSSDSSGASSQRETASEDTDGSNDLYQRKKRKTRDAAVQGGGSGFSAACPLPFTSPAECFHYKPMFVHQQTSSSEEQPSTGEETPSSVGPPEESHLGVHSRWDNSGFSGPSQRKRRRDGAIIYYTGAPFCTDLSGDWGDISPDSYACDEEASRRADITGPEFKRTASGSSIPFKPLSNLVSHHAMMDLDFAPPELSPETSTDSEDLDADFPWSDSQESSATRLTNLEASGLGGVTPDDHFVVVVSTRRPKSPPGADADYLKTVEAGGEESIRSPDPSLSRFAKMPTASSPPTEGLSQKTPQIGIEYVAGKIRRLPPAPLPPPTFFFLPSESLSEDDGSDFGSDDDVSDDPASGNRRLVVMQPRAVMPDEDAMMSGDDDDDEVLEDDGSLDEEDASSTDPMGKVALGVGELGIGLQGQGDTAVLGDMPKMTTGSSVATAGGMASDHSSFGQDSP